MIGIFLALLSLNLDAAVTKDFWYKVQSSETKKEGSPPPHYEFDSIENSTGTQTFGLAPLWNLDNKLGLGLGFLYDRPYIHKDHDKPFIFLGDFTLRDRAWNRLRVGGVLTFHSQFMATLSWDWTPSRKAFRWFYGLGAGMQLNPKDQIRNILSLKNYLLLPTGGFEFLIGKNNGLRVELKGLLGTHNIGALLSANYLISI